VITRINQAHPAVVYGLLAVLMAAVFVPMSLFRLVDGDEGTYLLVSRLVVEGQLPYHDFHYPQMFLLPYVYGAWMKLVGLSWYGARLLSAVFSVALGLLVSWQVARLSGRRAAGVVAGVLFTFSSLAFGWYPLVKTFVFPTLMLFGAYAVLSWRSTRWKWAASGFLLGLGIDSRVYLAAITPVFLVELYLTEARLKDRLLHFARFAVGLGIALLPNELFLLIDPETFIFNVFGHHAMRSSFGAFGWFDQKLDLATQMLGIHTAEGVTSLQFLLLFLLNVASWVSSALSRERLSFAAMISIPLLLVSLVPTPTYAQYFCMPLPFMIVEAVVFLGKLFGEASAPRVRHLLASVLAVYVLVSPFDLHRYTLGGDNLPGVPGVDTRANAVDWKLSTIRAVGQAIDRELRPGRAVAISFWPGYFVETKAAILPGLENHFAMQLAARVQPREVTKFSLMSVPALLWHVEQHTVDVIVIGNWTEWTFKSEWIRSRVVKNGYVMKRKIAGAEIYTLPPPNGTR
jgi:4-amino-4-deoxy-L-arabinose transferase-like glycosyltransferase